MNEQRANEFLSDLVVYNKYSNYDANKGRRKTWNECVDAVEEMHKSKYPMLSQEIEFAFSYVRNKKVMASMRSIQYGGLPIELNPSRVYNCSYTPIDTPFVFAEVFFMLLSGTGVGFSVRKRHIKKLPPIVNPQGDRRFLVGDSLEGWADSVRQLVYAYMKGKELPRFDYRDIRPKGSPIKKSGGRAPGSDKLRTAHKNIEAVLKQAIGRRLNELECHDIICYIADCVLAGGRRDSAMISLFDIDSRDMITCKSNYTNVVGKLISEYKDDDDFGWLVKYELPWNDDKINTNTYSSTSMCRISAKYGDYDYKNLMEKGVLPWYYVHPQRSRANNSIIMRRGTIPKKKFMEVFDITQQYGEPAFVWTNDDDAGVNPCCEIALNPNQFCNLTSVVVYDVTTQEELNARVRAAAFIGTLQAGYTDFHYLRSVWKETTEREALLGVSMTGIASGTVLKLDLEQAAAEAITENERIAEIIGINPAARVTTIKPEGSGSLAMGVIGSGIHAAHDKYFIRSMRLNKSEPLYTYLVAAMPDFVESEISDPDNKAVVSIPLRSPEGIITRDEPLIQFLDRIEKFSKEWVMSGHISGVNNHNVSATVSVREGEWDEVAEWAWANKAIYSGLSFLPYDGGNYKQAPFISISEEKYNELIAKFPQSFDFTKVVESESTVNHASDSVACGGIGGNCEV